MSPAMSSPDPLCLFGIHSANCDCYLIAKVRADERERIAIELEDRQGLSNAAWYVRHYGALPVDNEPRSE
jgi:hypothetical protein